MLKYIAGECHSVICRFRPIASAYLNSLRIAKMFSDGPWKQQVSNSVNAVEWPNVRLPPALVRVADGFQYYLTPHVGETDFRAHLFNSLGYEQEVFDWLRNRHYECVVEIGANVGIFTLFFSKLVGRTGTVYAFEPSRKAFGRLMANLSVNCIDNVQTFNCAVTDHAGIQKFFEPKAQLSNGSLRPEFLAGLEVRSTSTVTVNADSIGDLIASSRKTLLKIDAEGSEAIILKSLESVIGSFKPDIVVEVLGGFADEMNAIRWLSSTYEFYNLTPTRLVKYDRFIAGQCRDYCLLPREEARSAEC